MNELFCIYQDRRPHSPQLVHSISSSRFYHICFADFVKWIFLKTRTHTLLLGLSCFTQYLILDFITSVLTILCISLIVSPSISASVFLKNRTHTLRYGPSFCRSIWLNIWLKPTASASFWFTIHHLLRISNFLWEPAINEMASSLFWAWGSNHSPAADAGLT